MTLPSKAPAHPLINNVTSLRPHILHPPCIVTTRILIISLLITYHNNTELYMHFLSLKNGKEGLPTNSLWKRSSWRPTKSGGAVFNVDVFVDERSFQDRSETYSRRIGLSSNSGRTQNGGTWRNHPEKMGPRDKGISRNRSRTSVVEKRSLRNTSTWAGRYHYYWPPWCDIPIVAASSARVHGIRDEFSERNWTAAPVLVCFGHVSWSHWKIVVHEHVFLPLSRNWIPAASGTEGHGLQEGNHGSQHSFIPLTTTQRSYGRKGRKEKKRKKLHHSPISYDMQCTRWERKAALPNTISVVVKCALYVFKLGGSWQ